LQRSLFPSLLRQQKTSCICAKREPWNFCWKPLPFSNQHDESNFELFPNVREQCARNDFLEQTQKATDKRFQAYLAVFFILRDRHKRKTIFYQTILTGSGSTYNMTKWRVRDSTMAPISQTFFHGGMREIDWFSETLRESKTFNQLLLTATSRNARETLHLESSVGSTYGNICI